jgi:hypothetical protein
MAMVAYSMPRARYMDGTTDILRGTELYDDPNTMTVRTRHQDEQIKKLQEELKDKKEKEELKLKNLIAYYYKR